MPLSLTPASTSRRTPSRRLSVRFWSRGEIDDLALDEITCRRRRRRRSWTRSGPRRGPGPATGRSAPGGSRGTWPQWRPGRPWPGPAGLAPAAPGQARRQRQQQARAEREEAVSQEHDQHLGGRARTACPLDRLIGTEVQSPPRAAAMLARGPATVRVGPRVSRAGGAGRAVPSCAPGPRGCRSGWSRGRCGPAASAPRAGRRRCSAGAWRRHGGACAGESLPLMSAFFA